MNAKSVLSSWEQMQPVMLERRENAVLYFLAALIAYCPQIFVVEFVHFTCWVVRKLGVSCCLEDSETYLMNFRANVVPSLQ